MTWRKTLGDHLRQRLAEVELQPGWDLADMTTPEERASLDDAVAVVTSNVDTLIASTVARAEAAVALIAPIDDPIRQAIGENIAQHPGFIDWPQPWEPEVRRRCAESPQVQADIRREERAKWPAEEALSLLDAWARCKRGDRTSWMWAHLRGIPLVASYSLALDAVPKDRRDDARDLVCRRRHGDGRDRAVNVNDLTNLAVWLAWQWWTETQPERLAHHAASGILDSIDDELARGPKALTALSRAVLDEMGNAPTWREDVGDDVEGVYPLDEELAAFLTRIGGAGRKLSGQVREASKGKAHDANAKRWEPDTEPLRVPRMLARTLWFDVVAPRLQRQASRTDAPGMSMTALTSLMGMSRRGAQKELFHDAAVILDDKRRRVGSLRTVVEVDARHVNLADLNRLPTQRLIRWALHRGWDQKWVCDSPDPTRIVVDGGYPALALELGMKGKKAADELKGAVATLQSVFLQGPKGEGQVFAAWHHKASGQRRARLEMTLLGPFAPDYIARELAEHRNVNDKSVVPVPLPAHLPPLVGRERDHGSQAILQLLALRELRLRATELAADGAVDISARRWEDLRDEAGVPRATLADVLEAYPIGDGIRPAFMLQRDGRWDLAPDYSQERAAIVAAGEAIQKGKRGGEQAAATRRAGRAKPKTTRRAAK